MKYYSDVASEFNINFKKSKNFKVNFEKELDYGCKKTIINIDSSAKSIMYAKPKGEYYSLECANLFYLAPVVLDYMAQELSEYLKAKIKKMLNKNSYKALVVCLGNGNMVCDSLGAEVFEKLIISNQSFTENTIYAIQPSVFGKTNIQSVEHIEAVCGKIKPDICIIVDALCSLSISRIGNCVQVCDSGILAGGAMNRSNNTIISKKTLGIPTICIGIPLVVRLENIFNEFVSNLTSEDCFDDEGIYSKFKNVIVAPKNIDEIVKQSAYLISTALNLAILNLEKDEQELLKK